MENQGKGKAKEDQTAGVTPKLETPELPIDQFNRLMSVLEKQQKQIAELQAQRDAWRPVGKLPNKDDSVVKRSDHPAPGGGYLVKMPIQWTGQRMGVNFRNGYAIIPENHPQCDYLAHWLEADHPQYVVMAIDEAQVNEMLRKMEIMGRDEAPKSLGEKLMSMGSLGTGG
jgi:hypothetical protein